jgi:hypothetical protein
MWGMGQNATSSPATYRTKIEQMLNVVKSFYFSEEIDLSTGVLQNQIKRETE